MHRRSNEVGAIVVATSRWRVLRGLPETPGRLEVLSEERGEGGVVPRSPERGVETAGPVRAAGC